MTPQGLALGDDLIFFSRIAETAKAAGLTVRMARSPAELITLATEFKPSGVILDLQGLDVAALLAELRARCAPMPQVIAYGSHVEADVLRSARDAGCDRVLPRSQFVKELDRDIATWLKPVV